MVRKKSEKNVWVDGCFDIIHYGHINLIRNAKKHGKNVIVGVHSDRDIDKHKRAPIMQIQEKKFILESLRDVEKVVINAPYVTSPEIMDKYSCEFCVHGSDMVLSKDGTDPYIEVKSLNRFKTVPRTDSISSTEIIERMLFNSRLNKQTKRSFLKFISNRTMIFDPNYTENPKPGVSVAYVAGRFDLLHPALINYFKKIKEEHDFLMVGVYSDGSLMVTSGLFPILNSQERSIPLDALKYIDRVLINAPLITTPRMVQDYNVNVF